MTKDWFATLAVGFSNVKTKADRLPNQNKRYSIVMT
jgi:hypothetical protein